MIPLKGDKSINQCNALGWMLIGLLGRCFSKSLQDNIIIL